MKDLEITKGEYELIFHHYTTEPKRICVGIGVNEDVLGGSYKTMICDSILPETDAEYIEQAGRIETEMELFADAGNTAQKCGLLPSELLKQRDELKESLVKIMAICDDGLELNMSNYNHEDVNALNQTFVDIFLAVEAAIKSTEQ